MSGRAEGCLVFSSDGCSWGQKGKKMGFSESNLAGETPGV